MGKDSRVGWAAAWVTVGLSLLLAPKLHGQCYGEERQKIVASDGAAGDWFGWALAADGEWLLVGGRNHQALGTRSGAAWMYRRTDQGGWDQGATWTETTKLLASDGDEDDWFGGAVALDSDLAVVAAPLKAAPGVAGGAVYAYRFDGAAWSEVQQIAPADGEVGDSFGFDLAMDGDVLVVGNPTDDDACPADPICNSGSASVYRWDGMQWVEEAKLTASDAEAGALFGWNCTVSGDVLVIGAPWADGLQPDSGASYVFRFDGVSWNEEQKIVPSDSASGDRFGHAVDLQDDVFVVGVQLDDTAVGVDSGSAWIFRFDGASWVEERQLVPAFAAAGDNVGFAVDVEPGEILVSAIRHDGAAVNGGGWTHFEWDGAAWIERASFTASDADNEDRLGMRCVLDEGRAFVATAFDDDQGVNAGAVYETTLNFSDSFSYYGSRTRYCGGYASLSPLSEPTLGSTMQLEVRHPARLIWARGMLLLGTEPRDFRGWLVGGQIKAVRFRPDFRGRTLLDLALPDDPALCGQHVYAQVYVSGRNRYWWRCRTSVGWSRGVDLVLGDVD